MQLAIAPDLVLVGTSHIAEESAKEVRSVYDAFSPDAVAIELDPDRLAGLLSGATSSLSLSSIGQIGIGGFLFAYAAKHLSKKLGDLVNAQPGQEMLAAARLATENGKPLLLIDRHISITLQQISRVTFLQKCAMAWTTLKLTVRPPKDAPNLRMGELSRRPSGEFVQAATGFLRRYYAPLYRVLISERDAHMARMLSRYLRENPGRKVLAVVGAGHLPGLEDHLKALVR